MCGGGYYYNARRSCTYGTGREQHDNPLSLPMLLGAHRWLVATQMVGSNTNATNQPPIVPKSPTNHCTEVTNHCTIPGSYQPIIVSKLPINQLPITHHTTFTNQPLHRNYQRYQPLYQSYQPLLFRSLFVCGIPRGLVGHGSKIVLAQPKKERLSSTVSK